MAQLIEGKIAWINGNIITVDGENSIAQALMMEQGRIIQVGTNEEILAHGDGMEIRDLQGKTVLPGFVDGHGHISMYAQNMMKADLTSDNGVESISDLIRVMKELLQGKSLVEGEWLIGMGYDHADFPDNNHPTKHDLDQIATDIPIICLHASGHIGCANSKGLEVLGYYTGCPNPVGGVVVRFPGTDEPNGMLEEQAYGADQLLGGGEGSLEGAMQLMIKAEQEYASYGITTALDDFGIPANHDLELAMAKADMHIIDIINYPGVDYALEILPKDGNVCWPYENHFRVGGGKIVIDGSPQAKTAWLTKPYHIPPEGQGEDYCAYPIYSDEEVYRFIKGCVEGGWSFHVHCNGDAAGDQFIRVYEQVLADTGSTKEIRPVMIHCQTVREDQLDKMKELGILPSFFADHVYYWGDWHYSSVLGPERGERISPVHSALKRGMNYTLHQDPPVRKPNMILTIHNAVNRVTKKGRLLGADQRISVMDAIRGVTINGAYQCFEEHQKGSVEPGKYADLLILDANPLEIAPEQLRNIRVLETVKEGRTIYQAE